MSETLRSIVRDAIEEYMWENEPEPNKKDIIVEAGNIADVVFDAMGISEQAQDVEGGKVQVVL